MNRMLWAALLVLAIAATAGCIEVSGSSSSGSSNCFLFCGGSNQEASFQIDMGPFIFLVVAMIGIVAVIIAVAVAAAGRNGAQQQQQQQVVVQVSRGDDDHTRR